MVWSYYEQCFSYPLRISVVLFAVWNENCSFLTSFCPSCCIYSDFHMCCPLNTGKTFSFVCAISFREIYILFIHFALFECFSCRIKNSWLVRRRPSLWCQQNLPEPEENSRPPKDCCKTFPVYDRTENQCGILEISTILVVTAPVSVAGNFIFSDCFSFPTFI